MFMNGGFNYIDINVKYNVSNNEIIEIKSNKTSNELYNMVINEKISIVKCKLVSVIPDIDEYENTIVGIGYYVSGISVNSPKIIVLSSEPIPFMLSIDSNLETKTANITFSING